MKRTLSFMVMALALLFTQCRKPEVKFPTPSSAEGVTVSMTVTAGPGSKTDISNTGAITWSTGDKLYVGFGKKYIGFLTLVGDGVGSATGTFSGNVTLPTGTENGEKTFHFFYLGSTARELKVGDETVTVSFASQNIYADVNNKADDNKKLVNASAQHVGYGSANGTVTNGAVTGINVTLVSKVALARFSFTAGTSPYEGELTLSGDHIYNSMTVGFGGTFTGEKTDGGNISLGAGHAERYVMLVPPTSVSAEDVTFKSGNIEGGATFNNGIEANKFYGQYDAMAVTVEAKPSEANASASAFNGDVWNSKFSVGENTTVEFAPGNLYWDGSAFKFEANQWDFRFYKGITDDFALIGGEVMDTPEGTVGSFFWSKTASVAYAGSYSDSGASADDVFFTNASDFQVDGETAGTWRTLSEAEWNYLLYTRTDASSLRAYVGLTDVYDLPGLVILPDGSTVTAGTVTTTALVASSGAVFLPGVGHRDDTQVDNLGCGYYWSSSPEESYGAHRMDFYPEGVSTAGSQLRESGYSVRLVR